MFHIHSAAGPNPKCSGGLLVVDRFQLNNKYESSVWRNEAREAAVAVGIVPRDRENTLLTKAHFSDTFIPAPDDLANPDLCFEITSAYGRVELLAPVVIICLFWIVQISGVLDGDLVTLTRVIGSISLLQEFASYTHCEGFVVVGSLFCPCRAYRR